MIARALASLVLLSIVSLKAAAQVVRQDTTPLTPIVVTATRTPQAANTLGNSVTVLLGEDLRRAGITTVSDALRVVAGAAVVQQSSYGSVTSLFLRGGQSNYVRVLVDGVPINQPGGALDLSHVTTANVERLELVRGPSSVVYGSDAVTGVLQIFTRQGAGNGRLRAEARGGSYGSSELSAELSGGGARLGASVGASRHATDGLYSFNSQYDNRTGSGSLWLRPDSRTDLRVAGRYGDAEFHFPTGSAGTAVDSNQFLTSRGTTVSVDAGRQVTPRLELRSLFGYRESKDIYDDAPDFPGDPGAFHSDAVTDRKSADLRLNLRAAGSAVYTLGAVVEAQRERSWNTFSSAPQRIERTNRAAYAQAVRGVSDRVSVQAGARLEDNQAFGSFGTWRVGGAARVAAATRLRVNAGTSFKEPTFIENYSSGFATGNPDLRPERSFSWELGLEQTLGGGSATVSATFFSQRFRDLIQYVFAPAPNPNFFNIAGANASGLEVEAALRPGSAMHARVEYTWLHTSVADSGFDGQQFAPGKRLIRRPTHSGAISLNIAPAGPVSGGARWLLVGTRDDLDFGQFPATRVTLAGYGRLDAWAEIMLRRSSADFALTARLDNIMDQPYQEVFGFPVPGRRLLVGGRIGGRR